MNYPTLLRKAFRRVWSPAAACAFLCLGLAACNSGSRRTGVAPALAANGDMPTLRNVADPNAPFTLRPRPPQFEQRPSILDAGTLPVCAENQLSLFETRSRMAGSRHTLQMTLQNQGAACQLTGFPAITLLDAQGNVVAGITIDRVSRNTMEARVGRPASSAEEPVATTPSPQVLLGPHADAVFELGWTSGPDCQEISRIAVAAPGSTQSGYVPRQLAVCEDRILITQVAPGGME